MSIPGRDERAIILDEASRQLELAVHDSQVAFDCIALGNLDRAHTHAITARAAADAAETALRAALGGDVPRSLSVKILAPVGQWPELKGWLRAVCGVVVAGQGRSGVAGRARGW